VGDLIPAAIVYLVVLGLICVVVVACAAVFLAGLSSAFADWVKRTMAADGAPDEPAADHGLALLGPEEDPEQEPEPEDPSVWARPTAPDEPSSV
jgi:Flp pilus assembly pilin Flp